MDVVVSEKTFDDVVKVYQDRVDELLGDPLLLDLPSQVSLDEVRVLLLDTICYKT